MHADIFRATWHRSSFLCRCPYTSRRPQRLREDMLQLYALSHPCRGQTASVTRHGARPMCCMGFTVTARVAVSTSPWAPRIVAYSSYLPGTRQLVSIHPAMAYGGSWK